MRGNSQQSDPTVDFQATDKCPGHDSKVLVYNDRGGIEKLFLVPDGQSKSNRVVLKHD